MQREGRCVRRATREKSRVGAVTFGYFSWNREERAGSFYFEIDTSCVRASRVGTHQLELAERLRADVHLWMRGGIQHFLSVTLRRGGELGGEVLAFLFLNSVYRVQLTVLFDFSPRFFFPISLQLAQASGTRLPFSFCSVTHAPSNDGRHGGRGRRGALRRPLRRARCVRLNTGQLVGFFFFHLAVPTFFFWSQPAIST
jgi:hypothetical protein